MNEFCEPILLNKLNINNIDKILLETIQVEKLLCPLSFKDCVYRNACLTLDSDMKIA